MIFPHKNLGCCLIGHLHIFCSIQANHPPAPNAQRDIAFFSGFDFVKKIISQKYMSFDRNHIVQYQIICIIVNVMIFNIDAEGVNSMWHC